MTPTMPPFGFRCKKRWLSDRDILARSLKHYFYKGFPMPGSVVSIKMFSVSTVSVGCGLGSPKHYLFYLGASEIKKNVSMSRQSAELLASKGAYVDSSWIEEFFCGDHGKLWMKVTRKTGSIIVATLATSEDYKQPAQFYQTKSVSKRIHLPHESSDWDKSPLRRQRIRHSSLSVSKRSITVTSAALLHLSLVFNPGEGFPCVCRRV